MKRVLVTGGTGQLGTALQCHEWPAGWQAIGLGSRDLDLTNPVAIAACIARDDWAAVINCAAYTSADKAEQNIVAAWQINAMGPAALADACRITNIPLIQISTDYVFAGDEKDARQPHHPVGPLSVYGASKVGGELAVTTSGARHAVVRTSWLFSEYGHNFLRTMLRLAGERDQLGIVDDQYGGPTSAIDLAAALAIMVVRMVEDRDRPSAIYHFSNAGGATWADFAQEIFAISGRLGGPTATVRKISSSEYPTPARRPANSLLDTQAIRTDYGINLRPWQDALAESVETILGKAA